MGATQIFNSPNEFLLVDGEPRIADLWELVSSLSMQVCCTSSGRQHSEFSEASLPSSRAKIKARFPDWSPKGITDGLPQTELSRTILRLKGLRVCGPSGFPATSQDLILDSGVFQDPVSYEHNPDVRDVETYRGAFIHAGLIDLHTHLPTPSFLKLPELFALNYLAHGVTSVRSAGDITGQAVPSFFQAVKARNLIGPRVFYSGPFIGRGRARWKNTISYNHASEAAPIIEGHVDMGASCVKLYENLTSELISTIVRQGEAEGLKMLGHVPTALTVEEAGIPEPQHYFGVPLPQSLRRDQLVNRAIDWESVDQDRADQIVEHALRTGTAHLPTLTVTSGILLHGDHKRSKHDARLSLLPAIYRDVVWHPKIGLPAYRNLDRSDYSRAHAALQKKLSLTGQLYKNGAILYIGTDTTQPFVVPGVSLHDEINFFADAGVPRSSALEICTRRAGQRLGSQLRIGEISPGFAADFFISRQSPLSENWTVDNIEAVGVGGRISDIKEVRQTIKSALSRCDGLLLRPLSKLLASSAMEKLAKDFVN